MKRQSIFLLGTLTMLAAANAEAAEFEQNIELQTGIAYNDNVFRAPSQSYIDYGTTGNPNVVPERKSGFFIPLSLDVEAQYKQSKETELNASFKAYADYHLGSDLSNKDKITAKIDIGITQRLKKVKSKKNRLYAGLFIDYKDQSYYDRDTGTSKVSGASDISDKYSYFANGLKLKYRSRTTPLKYVLMAELGSRDYKDTVASTDQDYDYLQLAGKIKFDLNKQSQYSLGYADESQEYGARTARDLSGALLTSNPLLEYTYHKIKMGLDHQFSDQLVFDITLGHTIRKDGYLAYNDYSQQRIKAKIKLQDGKLKHAFTVSYSVRDYDNAFAFDNDTQANKYYDAAKLALSSQWEYSEKRTYSGNFAYQTVDTNDLHYNYDTFTLLVGIKQQF